MKAALLLGLLSCFVGLGVVDAQGSVQIRSWIANPGHHPGPFLDNVAIHVNTSAPTELLVEICQEAIASRVTQGRVTALAEVPGEDVSAFLHEHGFRYLFQLSAQVSGNFLELEGTWLDAMTGWRAVLLPGPERVRHSLLRLPLDAELRRLAVPLPRVTEDTVRWRTGTLPGRNYVLAVAHDLDRDGRDELVLATRNRVDILRVDPQNVRREVQTRRIARLALYDAPPPPQQLPRILGTARATENGLLVRLGHRTSTFRVHQAERSFAVSPAENPCGDGFPLSNGCGQPVLGRDYFRSELGGPEPAPAAFYEQAHRPVTQPDGSAAHYLAYLSPRGRLVNQAPQGSGAIGGRGLGLAMADVDQDGRPELLSSGGVSGGAGRAGEARDALYLDRLHADGRVTAIAVRENVAGSVTLAGHGDLDGDGLEELFAIAQSPVEGDRAQIWVIR